MPVVISLLRGVNVVGRNMIKMDALCSLYESLKFRNCRTYLQSGNVVFATSGKLSERSLAEISSRIETAIERKFGFRPSVILRTSDELRDVVARNPFAKRREIHPSKSLVGFMAGDASAEACAKLRAINVGAEEVYFSARELYIYFPNGVGRAELSWSSIDRAMKIPITGRNWNTVTKLLTLAETLESSK